MEERRHNDIGTSLVETSRKRRVIILWRPSRIWRQAYNGGGHTTGAVHLRKSNDATIRRLQQTMKSKHVGEEPAAMGHSGESSYEAN